MPKAAVMPSILSYPKVLTLDDVPELANMFVYVFEKYPLNGISVVAKRDKEGTTIKFGNWNGKELRPNTEVHNFIKGPAISLITLMAKIHLDQMEFYFSDNKLVDARKSAYEFLSPGMINDLFGKLISTQVRIGKPIILNDKNMELIKSGIPPYDKPIIIKTTSFKTIIRGKEVLPMYATVR